MSDRHVRPTDDGWSVSKPDAGRASATTATQADAITRAVEIVANDGGGTVIVHGVDDAVRETRDVESNADDTARIATELATAAAAAGAKETARAVSEEVSEVADDVADDVSTTAKKVQGHTRTGGKQVGATASAAAEGISDEVSDAIDGDKSVEAAAKDAASIAEVTGKQAAAQIDGTAREVAGETRAAARRTAATLEQEADKAGGKLVEATDRARRVGASVDDELHDVSDRTGRAIHAYTEAAAAPLDRLAVILNPVRITGRVVGLVAAGGLAVAGTVSGRATESVDRGARKLADR